MFAEAPTMDGPLEVEWDDDLARESRKKLRKSRRRLGRPAKLAKLRAELFKKQEGRCHFCARRMVDGEMVPGKPVADEQVTLEHLVAFADGGETSDENCRAACLLCNGLKGALEQSIRSLERTMREGLPHEVHYYAERLRRALDAWERQTNLQSPTEESRAAQKAAGDNHGN